MVMVQRLGQVEVTCDEHGCLHVIGIKAVDGPTTFQGAASAARANRWRAYADPHRRDLCPAHAMEARTRLTLVR